MRQEVIVAGDTLDFLTTVQDYPPTDGWTLKYRLTPRFATPTFAPIVLTATAVGGDYQIQASPATTATWPAGSYTWARWVEKTGARQTLDESGQLEVRADPAATAQGFDGRSHARKMLAAIIAVLENRASSTQRDMVGFTIGSRSQQFDQADTKEKLLELKSQYEWLVFNEDNAAGIARGEPNQRIVRVRFGQP